MKFLATWVALAGIAVAQDSSLPPVEAVLSAEVKAMPEPKAEAIPKGIVMAITASDPKAQEHVLQGLNALHAGWDFEAYRHFCAALQLDPDCLMAHWGVAMALIDPQPDLRDESTAALARMMELMGQKAASELERSYAYGLIVFLRDGSAAAGDIFKKASEQYPNDPQLKLLHALFSRDGYTATGAAAPGQENSERILKGVMEANPDNPVYIYAYLAIRAEAPNVTGDLPLARKLCQLAPDFPSFQHILGHFEWRCGNHSRAVEAFSKASQSYSAWMKDVKVTAIDCPGWIKAECYRSVALASKGDYPTALAVAKAVAAIPVPADIMEGEKLKKSANGEGARLLLWEARTLQPRLLMRRDGKGDIQAAIAALPAKESQKNYGKGSLCTWFYQGLAVALESRKSLEEGDLTRADQVATALSALGQKMQATRGASKDSGEFSAWIRSYEGLNVMAAEIRGLLSMKDKAGLISPAYSWFSTADEHQPLPSMQMPPLVTLPMEVRLGEYYLAKKEPKEAILALEAGNKVYPNDVELLARLQEAYAADKQTEKAAATAKQIETIKSE